MIRRPPRSTLFPYTSSSDLDALLPLRLPPDLPVYRLEDAGMAVQMAEYVSQAVIRFFRGLDGYEADMAAGLWQHRPNPRRADYPVGVMGLGRMRSEEHTSELQSQSNLVCRLLLE